ncbi:hypothetical protein FOZ62_010265, partial [Perkinsus olseni]
MAAHLRGRLAYVLLALMIPSSILSLASHKKKDAITPDQLEYRLAKPSDVLLGEMVEPEAGVFVAAEKGKGVVVASVEFGLVKGGDDWEFVGLPSLRVKEDWRDRGVGSELLKALVEYVEFLWNIAKDNNPVVNEATGGAGFDFN